MATIDYGNQARLLGVQADVARHVVKALKVLGRAKEEGVNVSSIFSQFFADDVLKMSATLAPVAEPSLSTSSSTSVSASSSTLCDSPTPSSFPEVGGKGMGKRSREEDTASEQDSDKAKRVKIELEREGYDEPGNEIQAWERVLPALTEAYQNYQRKIRDGRYISRSNPSALCLELDCQKYGKSVCCFNNDSYCNINVNYCACEDLNFVLVSNGFFPASPPLGNIAIAVEVFDLAEGVCDDDVESVTRLLLDVYDAGGVPLTLDYKGDPLIEKFPDAFTSALPWYRQLKFQSLVDSEA